MAAEDDRAIFPGGALAVHITHQPIYRALGIENVKHHRGAKDTTTLVLMRRLLSLDYLIGQPTLGWLPTEADKVQQFEALGIDRAVLPYRKYGAAGKAQTRCFALKLPIAPDEHAATFVYVDPGLTTDSELRAWGVAHAPLWAALRARTFAVHIVAVGTGVAAAERAAPVLKRWTQDGDGQGAATRPGRPRPTRESARKSPGLRKPLPPAIVNACARPAGSTRRLIVLSCCNNSPRARPPRRRREGRLTASLSGPPSA